VRVLSIETQLTRILNQQTLIAQLTGLFAATALLLASIGLYGITSYRAEMQTREVGVRVALGATPTAILGLFVRSGFTLVAVGLALGIPAALAVGRFLDNRLFGIHGADARVLAGATVALAACAFAAVILPARRASAVAPAQALRAD
jgi:ABC-type antimicrobial peptide transport system permease subunit